MNTYLFENRLEALNLEPMSLTRPVFDLRCGAFTFLERIQKWRENAPISLFVREELKVIAQEEFPYLQVNPELVYDGIWLNGIVLWDETTIDEILSHEKTVFFKGDQLVAANLPKSLGLSWIHRGGPIQTVPIKNIRKKEIEVELIHYLWDCISKNGEWIKKDSAFFKLGHLEGKYGSFVDLINSNNIFIGKGSKIPSSVVIDATDGPVIIGENVTVFPHTFLQGPLYIGDNCLIKAGAKIYEGTTIGPMCKVGGEVEASIFQGFSNKQHDGFLGHSYIGEWVNLGADTNNSDLKNNYTPVKVTVNGEVVDTNSLFIGLFMGDHSKTGINTMFNTGTIVGPCSNILGSGYPPKAIPPFSWVVNGKIGIYQFDKFIDTAIAVKKRRNRSFSSIEEQLYANIFQHRVKQR